MLAPAETSAKENHLQAEFETPIGIIPHQVSECILSKHLNIYSFHQISPWTSV